MTKEEIKAWVRAQDWSKTFRQIAELTGESPQVVAYRYRKYTGLPPRRRGRIAGTSYAAHRKIPVGTVMDWTLQDRVLADQYGCSRERIRQLRKQAGAPKSPRHGRKKFL